MSRILIIYTGGTIGMIEDPVTHKLMPFDFDHLIDNVPKIKMLNYEIDHVQFDRPIDSSNMDPSRWAEIANMIQRGYASYDGFVVLHGTDTMAYTASALSFMLDNLDKPVIITGSQLPIGEVRTDGEENLITALQIAAQKRQDCAPGVGSGSMVTEVAILFENYLWRGNRATKLSADNFNAFRSPNYPRLASIGLGIEYNEDALWRTPSRRPLNVRTAMDNGVSVVTIFPGMTAENLRHQLMIPGLKGAVLRTYGAGNAPTGAWFVDSLKEAIDRGITLVNVTQCISGSVSNPRYDAGVPLMELGVLPGHDITVEAALTKMMFLFGLGISTEEVRYYLSHPLCGEMTMK